MATTEQIELRDGRLIELLATGHTPTDAAAAVGCSATTVYRRMATPRFAARLGVARGQQWAPATSRLRGEFDHSVSHMIAVRDNAEVAHSTRLRAAMAICELALKTQEVNERRVLLAATGVQIDGLLGNNIERNDDEGD